jgi:ADP-ribosyl-[dinitrogen reductase] hydrolase
MPHTNSLTRSDRALACLAGGACGDALGAPVTFLSLSEIQQDYGPSGIREFSPFHGKAGAVSESTQLTLFTGEGLIEALSGDNPPSDPVIVEAIHRAYMRWTATKGPVTVLASALVAKSSSQLLTLPEMYLDRSDGPSPITELNSTRKIGTFARNYDQNPCGMLRVAPIALAFSSDPMRAFSIASSCARLTHGHPSASISAGAFAMIVAFVVDGVSLDEAIENTLDYLQTVPNHQEVTDAIIYSPWPERDPPPKAEWVGYGWTAPEALAVALHATASTKTVEDAIIAAANHDGYSSATASLAGNLAGALRGPESIPKRWSDAVEFGHQLQDFAEKLAAVRQDLGDNGAAP